MWEKNGITVVKHYIDRAFSAKTDNRPEFQQMIKDSSKKLFEVVLVWKFDRFARNRFDSANYKMILKKNGVHLISVMEPIAEGSQGILVETLLEGMAEYYSAELSEKVIRGQTENALKGKCTGGTGTIGYKIDEDKFYHLDPLTAPLVLEAFQRYDNGDKMVEIVNFLNDKGVRNMLGGKMTHSSVNTMLKNRRYIGELSFRDIVVPDAIPVIVPKELFDRVQKRLDKNKRAPACGKADEEYLLTTKLFCGKCGALMFGESGTSATGRTYYYYKCANVKRRKGCNKKTVQKDWLEDLVVRETMKLIQDDVVIDKIVQLVMDVQNQENTTIPLLEKQLREVNKKLDNLMKAIEDGLYTRTTKERLEALEIQKSVKLHGFTIEVCTADGVRVILLHQIVLFPDKGGNQRAALFGGIILGVILPERLIALPPEADVPDGRRGFLSGDSVLPERTELFRVQAELGFQFRIRLHKHFCPQRLGVVMADDKPHIGGGEQNLIVVYLQTEALWLQITVFG